MTIRLILKWTNSHGRTLIVVNNKDRVVKWVKGPHKSITKFDLSNNYITGNDKITFTINSGFCHLDVSAIFIYKTV